jgi:HK97 gp10 family phage protein
MALKSHSVRIDGLSSIIGDLKKMDKEMRRASAKEARAIANELRDAIRQAAPVHRGILKKSIRAKVRVLNSGTYITAAVVFEPEGAYWIPVEFGHSKGLGGKPVPPHPFVYPTRDRVLPGLLNKMEGSLDSVLVANGAQ